MSSPQFSPSPPHQYPQAIQLKLYQAFIFSIPILFSIILFLLFYLFYLKRRAASTLSLLPRTINNANITTARDSDLKNEQKNKMSTIMFDECMKTRDLLCCVCLGEFEVKEELLQVGSCKHMFHIDCIRYWLHNHSSTCPLCRAPVHFSCDDDDATNFNVNSKSSQPLPPMLFPSNLTPHEVVVHHDHQVAVVVVPTFPPVQQQQQSDHHQGSSSSGSGSAS